MKRLVILMLSVSVIFSCCVPVSAVEQITDIFGNDYIEFDANIDGFFDIKDFVRAKKYYADMPVTINLNFTDASSAPALTNMRKELLKK